MYRCIILYNEKAALSHSHAATALYSSLVKASSTSGTYNYTSVISTLTNYNFVIVNASAGNTSLNLIFPKNMTAPQYISDGRVDGTSFQIRTGVIVDWTNKKVGVRFLNLAGYSNGSDNSHIDSVWGLL